MPSCVSKLPDYQDVVDKTEVVNEYLVENKFLASTNMTLLNYARNVDALFANKVCQVSHLCFLYLNRGGGFSHFQGTNTLWIQATFIDRF